MTHSEFKQYIYLFYLFDLVVKNMVLLLRVDHLFSFERLDSLSSLFFENRILHNMFFLLLLREETGFTKI